MIKTRFAPSPTGYLHLGGARTALYNWLFARQHQGVFVLRIEDTDTERSTQESADQILESMKYLGLDYDEAPIFQSARLAIYQDYAQKLLAQNLAYEKDGAIYFKGESSEDVSFQDLIIGKINIPAKELKDFIILKSNGWPVYHFAVVIDDALMEITHVIRGMDHLSNTAKHIQLFKALQFNLPIFAHIPMILGPDKQRLSKRHGAQAVDIYQREGIVPEGLLNFLARLGWGYANEEFFSLEDLLQKFDLAHVSKNPAVFDPTKLLWLNSQHLRQMPLPKLLAKLQAFSNQDFTGQEKEVSLLRARCQTLDDLLRQLSVLKKAPENFDPAGLEKYRNNAEFVMDNLAFLSTELAQLTDFSPTVLEQCLRSAAEKKQIKAADLIHPTRLALSGSTVGPGLFEYMELLGQQEVIQRLARFGNFLA